jgi:hypothetical protein
MTRLKPFNGLLRVGKGVQWQGKRFATSTTTPFQVFNADTKRHQRNRAATLDPEHSRRTDYLRDEVARRLIDRFMVLALTANSLILAHQPTIQDRRRLWGRSRTSRQSNDETVPTTILRRRSTTKRWRAYIIRYSERTDREVNYA